MKKKVERARRVLAAQRDLDRLAGWALADVEHRQAEVEDGRQKLLDFLKDESAFGDLFAAAVLRRLDALKLAQGALRAERAAKVEQHVAERVRTRGAERNFETLVDAERRRDEQLRLAEAVDATLNRLGSGRGKVGG